MPVDANKLARLLAALRARGGVDVDVSVPGQCPVLSTSEWQEKNDELEAYLAEVRRDPQRALVADTAVWGRWCNDDGWSAWLQERRTQVEVAVWLARSQVNGEPGQCSVGQLGSRWSDVELNGREVRVAFYVHSGEPCAAGESSICAGRRYHLTLGPRPGGEEVVVGVVGGLSGRPRVPGV